MAQLMHRGLPQGGGDDFNGHPDYSSLLRTPPDVTEEFWAHQDNRRQLDTQVLRLTHRQLGLHALRISATEQAFEAILPLDMDPGYLRHQLRVLPRDKEIDVPLLDINTVHLYYANSRVLAALPPWERRIASSGAYTHLGALNYAEDLGHYMAPLVLAVATINPSETTIPQGEQESYEAWVVEQVMGLGRELRDIRPTEPFSELAQQDPQTFCFEAFLEENRLAAQTRPLLGSRLYHFRDTITKREYQPGKLNFTSALLLEIGEQFIHGDDSNQAADLACSALGLARYLLGDRIVGEYPYRVLGINKYIAGQLIRRRFDIETLDITRARQVGEIDAAQARQYFACLQLAYLNQFRSWYEDGLDNDGIAFEWCVNAIMNASVYVEDAIGHSYSRSSTPREDYPDDGTKGSKASNKQAHDVMFVDAGRRYPLQCKIGDCDTYAAPPVVIVKARKLFVVADNQPSRFKDRILEVTQQLEDIYRGNASASVEVAVLQMSEMILSGEAS